MSVFANEADGVTLERRVLVPLTVEDLAAAFCEMDDDQQARFFVEVARIVATWEPVARSMQPMLIGKHLGECDCSTDEARELVRDIASGIAAGECEAGTLARETRGVR